MPDDPAPRQCPYCAAPNPMTLSLSNGKQQVVCSQCCARGPERDSEKDAQQSWVRVVDALRETEN